jgi:hypothetical protein
MNSYLNNKHIKTYKNMPDYSKGKIYKIWSAQTDKVYIGSTTQALSKRMSGHRASYRKKRSNGIPYTTSCQILDHDDAKIELIENCPCDSREHLLVREGYYIRSLDCVNKCIPAEIPKERVKCPCGSSILKANIGSHFWTNKHQKYYISNNP